MKLYEINLEIAQLIDQMPVDSETGEILGDIEAFEQRIWELQMERKSIMEWLAKIVLNTRSEEAALKAEEQRLKARRETLAKKEERLLRILDRECAGEKTDLGIATLSYRATESVSVVDAERAVKWLKRKKYADCFRVPLPEVAKTEVKKLLKSGIQVPGVDLVKGRSYSLK